MVSVVRLALAAGMGVGKDGCLRIPCSPPPGATAMEALRCFLARSNLCGFFSKMIALLKTKSCANTAIQSIGSYVHSDDLMVSKFLGLSVEETLSSLVSPNSTRRLRAAQEPFPDGGVEAAVGGVPWAGSLHRGCSQE